MAIINTIKQRILQMDQGSFQNLCDQIIHKIGYSNLVSLGSQAGTQKTTKGTPDTYCIIDDNKYVFVECTTQQTNLVAKIKDDIKKCLDSNATGIDCADTFEVIYFHTSSNITLSDHKEFCDMCEEKGIVFTMWGIDKIANHLFSERRDLAKDYLGIACDTNQIFDVDSFVKQNDSSAFAAPLENEFLYRDEELKQIATILKTNDVVVISGFTGTGKTRLAIEYAKRRSKESEEILLCIRDNALPIYDDLKLYINRPGDYILLVDDANQIAGLSHILQYIPKNENGINVKIIITVRDYALNEVHKKLNDVTEYGIIYIKPFDNDKIEEIIKINLGIINKHYLKRISEISNGNARIAMIAGITARRENSLASLADVSKLYERYYGQVIEKYGLYEERDLISTYGIISFVDAFHIDKLDFLEPLLTAAQISRDNFIESVYKLHSYELVDIYGEKAVKVSEQCLSNYILKYVFFDRKIICLSDAIKAYFPINQSKTINSVNVLTNTFYSNEMMSYVTQEISRIWDELSISDPIGFFEFVKVFYPVNETGTLLLLKGIIDKEEEKPFEKNEAMSDNSDSVKDDVINILSGFYKCENYSDAIELLLLYYQKRPDLYPQFYSAIKQSLTFNKYSEAFGYKVETALFEQLKAFSQSWSNEPITYLFLDVAKYLLHFKFDWTESNEQRSFTINYLTIRGGKQIIALRETIWQCLLEVSPSTDLIKYVREIISEYGKDADESEEIIQEDCPFILSLIDKLFCSENLEDCILVDKYISFLQEIGLEKCNNYEQVEDFLSSDNLMIYKMMKGDIKLGSKSIDDEIPDRKRHIRECVIGADFKIIQQVLDVCCQPCVKKQHKIATSLGFLFEILYEENTCFIDTIEYYLLMDTPAMVSPDRIVLHLFELLEPEMVFNLITSVEYSQKNEWVYFYFYHFPEKQINKDVVQSLYSFLSDDSDRTITSSAYRRITFVTKYSSIDPDVFIKCCNIILLKRKDNPFFVDIYFSFLFHEGITPIPEVLDLFSSNMDLLEKIYLFELTYEQYFDYDGQYFKLLFQNNRQFLDDYLSSIFSQKYYNFDDYSNHIDRIYETEDSYASFEHIADAIIQSDEYPHYKLIEYFDTLIRYKNEEKVDGVICSFIENHHAEEVYTRSLFDSISKMTESQRIKYIKLFVTFEEGINQFNNLPLFSCYCSWSGSEVPLIQKKIDFLRKLSQEFHGIKLLEHKNYLEERIKSLNAHIKEVEINEILRGY